MTHTQITSNTTTHEVPCYFECIFRVQQPWRQGTTLLRVMKGCPRNHWCDFYRAMLCIRGTSHGPVSVCLCLSVCLSQVGVLLKRLNRGSHKQHHTIAQRLQFSEDLREIRPGSPPTRAPNAGGVGKNRRLLTNQRLCRQTPVLVSRASRSALASYVAKLRPQRC